MAFGAEVTAEIEEMFKALEVPGFFKGNHFRNSQEGIFDHYNKGFFVIRTKQDKDGKREENEYRSWRKLVPGVKARILKTKKKYRAKNKDLIKKKKALYYKQNAERIKLKSKEYRENKK